MKILDIKSAIKKEMFDLKDGPVMTVVANNLLKKHGSAEKAKESIKSSKDAIKKEYIEKKKEMEAKRVKKKADKLFDSIQNTCPICTSNYSDIIKPMCFNPCGHCVCELCSKNLEKKSCPICRTFISNIIKVYL